MQIKGKTSIKSFVLVIDKYPLLTLKMETIIDLTNTYSHHDRVNPEVIENVDSLNITVDIWNRFCNEWHKEYVIEAVEIPVQINLGVLYWRISTCSEMA